MKQNKEQYGDIPNVTDREYLTNSFHIPVWEDISVPEKIKLESPYQHIATGGRISYNEYNYGVPTEVLEESINFAMDNGLYYGVNVVSATCNNCGNSGDFHETCNMCGSDNIIVVTRVCGYLSFEKISGESRYNPGKKQEIRERVKHVNGFN